MEADIPIGGSPQRAPGMPTRLLSDERLAQAVAAGNEHAFTTLFKRYHQQLYRYSRSITGNDQDGQDALQSALTKALVALRADRRNAPVRPWLFRIVHNESISLIRSRSTAQDLPAELEARHAVVDSVEQRERLTLLIADLREMPERQRAALVMRELSGLSHEEIAQALQVSVGAAKQVILEARRSLQEFAEGRAMTCDAIQQILSDADRRSLRSRKVRAHLRDCASCSAFAAAIPNRRADMLALAPALPAAGAASLLAKLTGVGSGHGGGGGAGLVAGTAAKGIGVSVSAKVAAVAGAAVVATATVGAVTVLPRSAPTKPAAVSHMVTGSDHASQSSSATVGAGHGAAIGPKGAHGNGLAIDHGRRHKSHGKSASPAHRRNHAHSSTHGNSAAIGNATTHGNSSTHGSPPTHGNSAASSATHGKSSAAQGHSVSSSVAAHGHAQTTHAKSETVKPSLARLKATTRAVHRRKRVHRARKLEPKTRSKPIRRTKTETATRGKATATTTTPTTTTTTTTTTVESVTSTTDLSGSVGQSHGNSGTPSGQGGNASANKSIGTP